MQGLGKTITALGLILSTKGDRPAAPPGKEVITLPDVDGWPASLYEVNGESKVETPHATADGTARRSARAKQATERYTPPGQPEPVPGPMSLPVRARRSNSGGAGSQPAACEAAQAEQSSAAVGVASAQGLGSPGCASPEMSNQGWEVKVEIETPPAKRQKLEDGGTGDVGTLSYAKACPKTTWVQCDICNKWRPLEEVCTYLIRLSHCYYL